MPPAQRILVLHAGALGDCVLAIHLILALKSAESNASIALAARSPIARWAKRVGLIDEAKSLDQIGAHALYHPDTELPDCAVDFFRQFDDIVSFLGDSSETVNRRLAAVCRGDVVAIDPRPLDSTLREGTHITRQWAQALRSTGLDVADPTNNQWSLPTSPQNAWRVRLADRLGVQSGRIALCHPGSGGLAKCCPLEALEQLIAALMERRWTVAWMIGPDEMERFGGSYRERLETTAPVIYEESFEQAAELACGAEIYIGNDAGMTHVTAIAGVPTIAIFGPTDPRVWRPLGCATDIIGFASGNQSYAQWAAEIVARIDR